MLSRRTALRPDRSGILALVVAAVALRLASAGAPARPDEAGYLLVASQWQRGGEFLYGDLWLDRPPLLLAFFRLADVGGGIVALRVLALVPVAVLVLAAADAGRTVGGARAGLAAAAVAAALQASPLLAGPVVDGEILALPLVMVSIALGLRALAGRPGSLDRDRYLLLVLAGAAGGAAVLVKQNFVDGLVLLGALLVVQLARGRLPAAQAVRLLGALLSGVCVPALALLLWAAWAGVGVADVWDPLVSFRSASLRTILSQSLGAPAARARQLAVLAALSGLVPMLLAAAWTGPHRGRAAHVLVATGLLGATEAVSIVLGGSYWTHYLLQLVPAAVLATALATAHARPGVQRRVLTGLVLLVLLSSVVAAVRALPSTGAGCRGSSGAAAAAWLRQRAEPGDSVVTLYGGADVLLDTGLRPAYPYLWSLPVRVLDPDLRRLETALAGPGAATWVVQSLPVTSWGLDGDGSLRRRLQRDYRLQQVVCGREIYRRSAGAGSAAKGGTSTR